MQIDLIATAKKGDIEDPRPIIILEPFFKFAACYSLALDKRLTSAELEAHCQYGCGAKGGSELAFHKTQALIERAGPACAILLDDKKNCFNEQDRATNLEQLYSSTAASNIWGIAHFSYGGSPTVIVYRGSRQREPLIIFSEQGARQGCPIGSLKTCYGLIPTNNQASTFNLSPSSTIHPSSAQTTKTHSLPMIAHSPAPTSKSTPQKPKFFGLTTAHPPKTSSPDAKCAASNS